MGRASRHPFVRHTRHRSCKLAVRKYDKVRMVSFGFTLSHAMRGLLSWTGIPGKQPQHAFVVLPGKETLVFGKEVLSLPFYRR